MQAEEWIARCLGKENPYQPSLLETENETCSWDEQTLIDAFILYVKKHWKMNLCPWESSTPSDPGYLFLGGDRGILAYVVFRFWQGSPWEKPDLSWPLQPLIKQVTSAFSRLDRPIFYLYFLSDQQGPQLLFETDEQIKDRLFHDETCLDPTKSRYLPDCFFMGDASNLHTLWNLLKSSKK